MSKSLHKNAGVNFHILHIASAAAMIVLSIFLTMHYFEAKYPEGLGSSSGLCNYSSFISCDITTFSSISNILGVPIAIFGFLMGIWLLISYFFQSNRVEGTNHFLLRINAVICTLLTIYSFAFLKGFCPLCIFYYLSSLLAFWVYFKTSHLRTPSLKVLTTYTLSALVLAGTTFAYNGHKKKEMNKNSTQLIQHYDQLTSIEIPKVEAPYFLEKTSSAPLQLIKFSDFQCPACRTLSNALHKIAKKYKGKINMQYMFYPLDNNCNPKVTRPLHPLACEAAYLASCLPEKFKQVEADIFDNQEHLSKKWITNYAKKENVYNCYTSPNTKEKVAKIIRAANPYKIKGTPTLIVNGKKIDRMIPLKYLYIILDELIKRSQTGFTSETGMP